MDLIYSIDRISPKKGKVVVRDRKKAGQESFRREEDLCNYSTLSYRSSPFGVLCKALLFSTPSPSLCDPCPSSSYQNRPSSIHDLNASLATLITKSQIKLQTSALLQSLTISWTHVQSQSIICSCIPGLLCLSANQSSTQGRVYICGPSTSTN